jgi:hypothetical protein
MIDYTTLLVRKIKHSRYTPVEAQGRGGRRHAPAAFYPREKVPRYPLDMRLGGPQSRSGQKGYTKNHFASAGNRTSIARSSSPWSDTILTELHRLPRKKEPQKLKSHHYACVKKKILLSYALQWCEFNFCLAITFFPIKLSKRSLHLITLYLISQIEGR